MNSKFEAGWKTPTELHVKLFDAKEKAVAFIVDEMNRAADVAHNEGDIELVSLFEAVIASTFVEDNETVTVDENHYWVEIRDGLAGYRA